MSQRLSYRWYLVGLMCKNEIQHEKYFAQNSAKVLVYADSDQLYTDVNACISDGSDKMKYLDFPDSLGCKLVIEVLNIH